MRILKMVLALVVCGAIIFSASCASKSGSAMSSTSQAATVKKGNITIDVTATGNLALSRTEDLAFEIAGTVEDVLVNASDSVKEGQELVKLDTSEWENQLKTLAKALETAQRSLTTMENNLTKAQRNVTTKEGAVTKAERQVTAKELTVRQTQLDLQAAQDSLNKIAPVKAAQDAVDNAESGLEFVQKVLSGEWVGALTVTNPAYWVAQQTYLEQALAQAKKDLQDILGGSSTNVSSDVTLQIAKSKLQLEQTQRQLEDAQIAVDDAGSAVDDAKLAVEDAEQAVKDAQLNKADAEQAVKDAQSALDEAQSLSPVIKATFAGFITKVNVKGGDEVKKGTVAVQLADPTKFEAVVLVSERDISSIKIGGDATVGVDALEINLPAKVTYIAPTATISQGVVNYQVTVEVQSLQPVRTTTAGQGQTSTSGQGSQRPSTQTSTPAGTPTPAATPQAITVKQGLSATITIPILQRNDVLLVPNRAISRQGRDTVVQVIKDGVTETRTITTGVSDLSNTEVTSGLSEGEQVVIPQATSSTSTSTPRPGGGVIFGPGGVGR